jgi:hypothetical protein
MKALIAPSWSPLSKLDRRFAGVARSLPLSGREEVLPNETRNTCCPSPRI